MPDHNYFSNLIWQIADFLRGPYRPPQHERVMLPMTVLRRFDSVPAPETLTRLEVCGPPIEEQRAIAACITENTLKINTLRFTMEGMVDLLKKRRSALIAAAVTGQIEIGATRMICQTLSSESGSPGQIRRTLSAEVLPSLLANGELSRLHREEEPGLLAREPCAKAWRSTTAHRLPEASLQTIIKALLSASKPSYRAAKETSC